MPEALTLCNTYCISLPIASVYLLHHELKSWYEMSSKYSIWMKAAIMAATHMCKRIMSPGFFMVFLLILIFGVIYGIKR